MIYSLQLILVFLCIVGVFMCSKANKGVHAHYLTGLFVLIALAEFLQPKTSGWLKASGILLAVPETLSLLIPSVIVGYVRSSLGFQNPDYSKWLLIPAFLYLKAFSYLYVAGEVSEDNFLSSTFYVCASVGGAVYHVLMGLFLFHFFSKEYAGLSGSVHPVSSVWLKNIIGYLLFSAVIAISGVGIRHIYGEYSTQYIAYEWFWSAGLVIWLAGMIFLMIKSPFVLNKFTPNVQVSYWEQEALAESTDVSELKIETQNHYEQISPKKEIPPEVRANYIEKIRHELEVREIFLDPKLTLSSLAKRVSISPHQLSYIINSEWKMNFNEFINSYRIAKAQLLLQDVNHQTATIFAIGIDSGFNSESSFYTAFKKATGFSPKRYRETLKLTSEL